MAHSQLTKFFVLVIFMLTSIVSAARPVKPMGEPLPWPFPWARECPVDWSSMVGRYYLDDPSEPSSFQIQIDFITASGAKQVRVQKLNAEGEVLAEGMRTFKSTNKVLTVHLKSNVAGLVDELAVIRMHYQSNDHACDADSLVPILTLKDMRSSSGGDGDQFKLSRARNAP